MGRERYIFVADVHLGADDADAAARECRFVAFLDSLDRENVNSLYLLGDIFDFWFEFRRGVPDGYDRVLDAMASLTARGVEVFFVKGNHDQWTYGYLASRTGVKVLDQPCFVQLCGLQLCLGHGHSVGSRKFGERLVNSLFESRVAASLFRRTDPVRSTRLARSWSASHKHKYTAPYELKPDNPLLKWLDGLGRESGAAVDHYIFGHFHCGGEYAVPSGGVLHILRGWIPSPGEGESPAGYGILLEAASAPDGKATLSEFVFTS